MGPAYAALASFLFHEGLSTVTTSLFKLDSLFNVSTYSGPTLHGILDLCCISDFVCS